MRGPSEQCAEASPTCQSYSTEANPEGVGNASSDHIAWTRSTGTADGDTIHDTEPIVLAGVGRRLWRDPVCERVGISADAATETPVNPRLMLAD